MVDISKIKTGDEIRVKIKNYLSTPKIGGGNLWIYSYEDSTHSYPIELIEHIPAKRDFKAGDRVKRTDYSHEPFGTIIAVDENSAWVKFPYRDGGVQKQTWPLGVLVHID